MKKTIFLIALCFWGLKSGIGQDALYPKVSTVNIYGDFGIGPWTSVTINMEVRLVSSESNKVQLYARGGFGSVGELSVFCEGRTSKGGIFGLTMLAGRGNHNFEISGGAYLGKWKEVERTGWLCGGSEKGSQKMPLIDLGYRYQNPNSQFMFRAKVGVLGVGIGLGFTI
jgi:hypothetical protein